MQPTEQPTSAKKEPRTVEYVFAGISLLIVLSLAVFQCHTEHGHVVELQADSIQKRTLIEKITGQLRDVVALANLYKAERDSVIMAKDSAVEKMTYAQKVAEYFRGLLANKTATPAELGKVPKLTDERVVTAGLKTIQRENYFRTKNDTLFKAISVLEVQIMDLKVDKLALKTGLVNIQAKAQSNVSGGVWPLNHKRRRQNKEIAKQAGQVLQSVAEKERPEMMVSPLENAVNKP